MQCVQFVKFVTASETKCGLYVNANCDDGVSVDGPGTDGPRSDGPGGITSHPGPSVPGSSRPGPYRQFLDHQFLDRHILDRRQIRTRKRFPNLPNLAIVFSIMNSRFQYYEHYSIKVTCLSFSSVSCHTAFQVSEFSFLLHRYVVLLQN
jgi:hypothetical protein